MKVLVTGARGLVGRALAVTLAEEGHAVVATGRQGPPLDDLRAEYVAADLASMDDILRLFGHGPFDVLVHSAARIRASDDGEYVRDNVTATAYLADAAVHAGAGPCVLLSTISVYSGEGPYSETSPARATDSYGRTKHEAEQEWLRRLPNRAVVLRLAGVHGPQRQNGVVHQMATQAARGADIKLDEPDTQVTLTFVDDVVAVVSQILRSTLPADRIFNLANGEAVTYRAMAESLCAIMNSSSRLLIPDNPRTRNRVLDTSRINKELHPHLPSLAAHLRRVADAVLNAAPRA